MPLPSPHPGLVIGYAYLWKAESRAGKVEAEKHRPCAIVLAWKGDNQQIKVTVAPITHRAPLDANSAVEIPAITKRRLGLDAERSWVVITEVNQFEWPGPDLRPISREHPGSFDYGVLPPKLFRRIRDAVLRAARERRLQATWRAP